MAEKRVYLHTVRQWLAGLLLMCSLQIVANGADFDLPHMHSESEPMFPTTIVYYAATGNVSATTLSFTSRERIPERERCSACAGFGTALVSHSLTMPICSECLGTGRKQG